MQNYFLSGSIFFGTDSVDQNLLNNENGVSKVVHEDKPMRPIKLVALAFFPCFVGSPCSEESKEEYKKAIKSFCFVVSFAQIVMMLVALILSKGDFGSFSSNPSIGPQPSVYISLGAKYGYKMRYSGQVWRFITPIFLHAGILHIIFGLYAQLRMGLYLESKWGWIKFTVIYFISGFAGVVSSCIFEPSSITVAASASVNGILYAHLTELIITWQRTEKVQRNLALLQIFIITTVITIFGFISLVDNSANAGAALLGFLLGLHYFAHEMPFRDTVKKVFMWGSIVLIVIYFVLGFSLFYTVIHPKLYKS